MIFCRRRVKLFTNVSVGHSLLLYKDYYFNYTIFLLHKKHILTQIIRLFKGAKIQKRTLKRYHEKQAEFYISSKKNKKFKKTLKRKTYEQSLLG